MWRDERHSELSRWQMTDFSWGLEDIVQKNRGLIRWKGQMRASEFRCSRGDDSATVFFPGQFSVIVFIFSSYTDSCFTLNVFLRFIYISIYEVWSYLDHLSCKMKTWRPVQYLYLFSLVSELFPAVPLFLHFQCDIYILFCNIHAYISPALPIGGF